MASWDSADLLSLFNQYAQRPTSDEVTSATKYDRLSKAQLDVIRKAAAIYPYPFYNSSGPTACSTSDNKVYTFGTDGNATLAQGPLGHVAIFRNLADYPDNPLIEGVDYLNEGTQIRIPNNRTETSLYWFGIPTPKDIAAGGSAEPSIRPAPARILIVIEAVRKFAMEGGRDPYLAESMQEEWNREFPTHLLAWRTQFRKGGALNLTGIERAILTQGKI